MQIPPVFVRVFFSGKMDTTNYRTIEDANILLDQHDPQPPNREINGLSVNQNNKESVPIKIHSNEPYPATAPTSKLMECGVKKVVIFVILALVLIIIVVAAVLASIGGAEKTVRAFPFDDAVQASISPKRVTLRWITANSIIVEDVAKSQLKEVNVETREETPLVDNLTNLKPDADSQFFFSKDRKFVLFSKDIKKVYRHSTTANYYVYDVDNKKTWSLQPKGIASARLQYAAWSPVGVGLVFVHDNDVYHVQSPKADPVPITDDGVPAIVFNGVPDWVYEEEVLTENKAVYWSPSGSKLAFLQFNDTQVRFFDFPYYGDYHNAYTSKETFRYPKAGFTNPDVKLFVRDVSETSKSDNVEILPPKDHTLGDDYLVSNVVFRDDATLLVVWTNRVQNESMLTLCVVAFGDCHVNLEENSDKGWVWVMPKSRLFLATDGSAYFLVLPNKEETVSYPHVAMVKTSPDPTKKGEKSFISSEAKEVVQLDAFRKIKGGHAVFFTAGGLGTEGARQRHLYVSTTQSSKDKCLTCDLKSVGKSCRYFSAAFFPDSQSAPETETYFVLNCVDDGLLYRKGADPPFTATFKYNHDSGAVEKVQMLESNDHLRDTLKKYDLPKKEHFSVKTDDNLVIDGRVFLPPFFKVDGKRKHPVLFQIYSGPSTNKVNEKWLVDWHAFMTTAKGYVVVNIDGRGSDMRGDDLRFAMYRHLGGPEIDDVILAGRFLRDESKWKNALDPDRFGVWGWSYGGFATSHVLTRGTGVFTCGAAVAPVSSWNYYDSIYTERYMSTPTDNPQGYEDTRLMLPKRVEKFRDVHYLLIHGTADDNVHFQNAMQLTTALIRKQVPFETQVYPDKTHSIAGVHHRLHLYAKLTDFFERCDRKKPTSRSKRSADAEEGEFDEPTDAFRASCVNKDLSDC